MAFPLRIAGNKPVFFQIFHALFDKFPESGIPPDAGAVFPGKQKTFRIYQISPEKGPGAADIWPDRVDGAALSLPEENTVVVVPDTHLPFAPAFFAVRLKKGFGTHVQTPADPLQIIRAEHNAAFSLTALTAHGAGENRYFVHDQPFLISRR